MRSGRIVFLAAALAVIALVATGGALAGDKCALSASADKCCANLEAKYKKQGWLGVEKEQNQDGTFTIRSVTPGSPAEQAGLSPGDVIESISGEKLTPETGARVCSLKAGKAKIGDTVAYGIRRGGERLTVNAKLAKIPETALASLIEKHKEEHGEARN